MIEYTVPEILRVNLTNTILQLKAMGIHDVVRFDYMEEPDPQALLDGLKQLYFLRAIDSEGVINALGRELAKYPLEPSYAKALLTSLKTGCHEEMMILVSLLSTENVYTKVSRTNEEIF